MDVKQAVEIVESLGVIEVNYEDCSVWIENINEETNEVKVRDLRTDRQFVVDVSQLSES
jgi:small acid-soluble spore protein H (minor)